MAKTVLIVEDEKPTREGFARALKDHDWEVEAVGNIEAALSALRSGKSFDIMLLDRRLLVEGRIEDGSTVLRIAKEQGLPLPLVVVISAYLDATGLQTFLDLGVLTLLSKPVRTEIIPEILKALCDGVAPLTLRGVGNEALEAQLIESNEGRMLVYGSRNDASFDIPADAQLRTVGVGPRKVFISHIAEEESIAAEIATALEVAGHSAWYYERDIYPVFNWLHQVSRAIDDCRVVLVLISPESLHSKQIEVEIAWALEKQKYFLPVLHRMSWAEFQKCECKWRLAFGFTAGIEIPQGGVSVILPRVVKGLEILGI